MSWGQPKCASMRRVALATRRTCESVRASCAFTDRVGVRAHRARAQCLPEPDAGLHADDLAIACSRIGGERRASRSRPDHGLNDHRPVRLSLGETVAKAVGHGTLREEGCPTPVDALENRREPRDIQVGVLLASERGARKDPEWALRFLRPLTSATLAADGYLFGRSELTAHAHSVLWLVGLVCASTRLLERWLAARAATRAGGRLVGTWPRRLPFAHSQPPHVG